MKLSCPSCDVITAKIHYIDTKTAHKQGFFFTAMRQWDQLNPDIPETGPVSTRFRCAVEKFSSQAPTRKHHCCVYLRWTTIAEYFK